MGASDPQRARRPAVEGRGDPRRPADRQPRERRRLHQRRPRRRAPCSRTTPRSPSPTRASCSACARPRSGSRRRTPSSRRARSRGASARASRRSSARAAAMRALFEQLDKVVDTRVTVLIEGETGVGKELIAAAVHYRSRRRDKLFVSQNCAAMPENLLESELFGHKKGSFTGAHEDKKGLFEIADGGTLFLDEVTEMPLVPAEQAPARAAGGGDPRRSARRRRSASTCASSPRRTATSRRRSPRAASARTSTTASRCSPSACPPLRERREDIPLLAEHFLERYTAELGKPAAGFSQQAMELLAGLRLAGQRARAAERGAAPRHPDRRRRLRHARAALAAHPPGRGRDRAREADEGHAQGDDGPARALAAHRGAARARQQQDGGGAGRSASPARGCTRSSAASGCEPGRGAALRGAGRGAAGGGSRCSSEQRRFS